MVGEAEAEGLAPKERLLSPGTLVFVRTHEDRTTFERLLGEVFVSDESGELESLGEAIILASHAQRSER